MEDKVKRDGSLKGNDDVTWEKYSRNPSSAKVIFTNQCNVPWNPCDVANVVNSV